MLIACFQRLPLIALLLALAACGRDVPSGATTPLPVGAVTAPSAAQTPADRLLALFDRTWQRRLAENPAWATYLGDARYNDRWEDLSAEALEQQHAQDREALEQLAAIDRATLPAERQLDYDLFRHDLQDRIDGYALGAHLAPVHQLDGVQLRADLLAFMSFRSLQDYEHWLARLQGIDDLVDQTIALMRRGMAERRLPPQVVMRRVLPQLAALREAPVPEHPWYAPFRNIPEAIDPAVREQLQLAGQSMVSDFVVPAFGRLQAFIETTYLPACPENAFGLSSQPRGAELYAWLVRHHTSSDLSPEAIHELGLREVARIGEAMTALMRAAGHTGSTARFRDKLSWNPRYRYDTEADLLRAYRDVAKRIDPELPRLFGRLPRTPYGVRAIDPLAAPSAPAAYYYPPAGDGSRAGYFYANTHKPKTRAGWEMEALTLHEAVPGHHLQVALAQELEGLPDFRRLGLNFTAFVEGWALYAESLGPDLGLYQDYGTRFGALSFEMWRAVRLVVDTGLHAKGWSRKQAREYFARHVAKPEEEISVEVDRYIALPGQALAYKLGERKIRELRERAAGRLGERFDIRAFHDAVLGHGPLPLPLLEREVDAWIGSAAGAAGAGADPAQAAQPGL